MKFQDKTKDALEESLLKLLQMQGVGAALSASEEVSCVRKYVKLTHEDVVFFDVGANIGNYTHAVLEIFPHNTHIHCFEPGRATFEVLTKNVNALPHNVASRVRMNNVGLSSQNQRKKLYYDNEGSGLASLHKRRLEHFNIHLNNAEEIALITLEKYCEDNTIGHIDVLKLDVEGHELDVLYGARSLFEKQRIGMVQFEFGGCNIDSRTYLQDFHYFFQEYGYFLFRMCRNNELFPLFPYQEHYEIPLYQNILACK